MAHFLLKHKEGENFFHDGQPIETCNIKNHSTHDRRNFHGIVDNDNCISLKVFKELFLRFINNLKEKYLTRDFLIVCFDKISMDILDNIFKEELKSLPEIDLQIVCLKSLLPIFNYPRKRSQYFFEKCWFHTFKYLEDDFDCCSRSILSEALGENKHVVDYQMNWFCSKIQQYRYVQNVTFVSGSSFDTVKVNCKIGVTENSKSVYRNMFLYFSKNLSENLYLNVLKRVFSEQ